MKTDKWVCGPCGQIFKNERFACSSEDIKDFANKLRKVALSDPVAQQNLDAAIAYLDLAVLYEDKEAEQSPARKGKNEQ
jgi:hypothetical protein